MSIITIEGIAFVRFRAPDLDAMRRFLLDFGLSDALSGDEGPHEEADAVFMRGTDKAPFAHWTERGEAGFAGIGLLAGSIEDLRALADAEGKAVAPLEAPGGGWFVRLTDPNGFTIDVVAGQRIAPVVPAAAPTPWNFAGERVRTADPKRVPGGAASVSRLGHVVMIVDDLQTTWRWWQERFGLLVSDEVRLPDDTPVALFIRCDRGSEPADHHALNFAIAPGKPAAFHHAAFEVRDLDSLMAGHDHLRSQGYQHVWGVGRHILGSQVFDYWCDPFGNKIEHWTDGDVYPADVAPTVTDIETMLGKQWGPPTPANFV